MTAPSVVAGGMVPLALDTPEQLRDLMRADFVFSDQQFAAISAPLEPASVIAGAGAGKTTVMAARVVWLVATGALTPDQVLGLTFTAKATRELATGIRRSLDHAGLLTTPGDPRDRDEPVAELLEPTVSTYNAYAAGLLVEHGLRIGHEPDTRVIADASRYQLAARAIAHHVDPVELLSDHPGTVIGYLLALDAAMSEHLVSPAEVRAFHAAQRPLFEAAFAAARLKTHRDEIGKVVNTMGRRDEVLGLVDSYRELKQRLGLMDFSDQIERAARLADECPEVGEAERERYRIVLLDEYQDTSVAQALMLRRLFSGPDAESGRGFAVTAVGDPNQAIYGWRGASVSNVLGFGHDFPRADGTPATTHALTVNRRSDLRILEVANTLATPLRESASLVRPLEPKPGAADGVVRTAVFDTYAAELAWLPAQVRDAHDGLAEREWSRIGVLTRDNAHAADVFDALSEAEIPVEIVGLQGLLRLPEVAEVVATLTLLHDLTANAELLMLLTGPRWAIGERDLALLGRRAASLSQATATARRGDAVTIGEELANAVKGADPTEVASLWEALDNPGGAAYSDEARERFALLAAELRELRRHAGEPLLDLVRRIIDTTGIDVELASSPSPAAAARRDNLDLFVKAVGEFQAIDGDVTLPALLAYLATEDEFGTGLDVATPTGANSVKLLTVHRAKGLEWDAVFLVGVCEDKFPITRSRTKWTSGPGVLPTPLRGDAADQPQLGGFDHEALATFAQAARDHQAVEELRLGYVALTRARHLLVVSSYCWNGTRKSPLGPSSYQVAVRDAMAGWGDEPEQWCDKPGKDTPNPLLAGVVEAPWPVEAHRAEVRRRRAAVDAVEAARADSAMLAVDVGLDAAEAALAARWDAEAELLLAEARRGHADAVRVPLPPSLSATSLVRLRDEPGVLARELARPMPRQPSPEARFGTRFHAYVEARFGQLQFLGPDELPGRADSGIDSDSDLADLVARFEAGAFGDRPPFQVEAPFALVVGGQVVRGRIDAVYQEGPDRYLVVDWKTNRRQTADPLQLAVYRLAWAELAGVPVESVAAGFHYVRTDQLVLHDDLPGRAELERLLHG